MNCDNYFELALETQQKKNYGVQLTNLILIYMIFIWLSSCSCVFTILNPFFPNSFLGYHTIQTKSRLSILGMGKVKNVTPLSEQAAIDLGVEILGDAVVIACALGIYMLVETRQSKHKEHEEELKFEEMRSLKELVVYQSTQIESLDVKVKELEQILNGSTMYSETSERVVAEFTDVRDSAKT